MHASLWYACWLWIGLASAVDLGVALATWPELVWTERNPVALWLAIRGGPAIFACAKMSGTVLVLASLVWLRAIAPKLADIACTALAASMAAVLVYLVAP